MLEIAMNQRANRLPHQPALVGLAAPQIGAFVRMILWDVNAQAGQTDVDPEFKLMINPHLVRVGQHEELEKEACHSTGNIRARVYRATSVTVSYTQGGREPTAAHIKDPFQARIIQHEVDHLNGVRCPDRIRSPKDLISTAGEVYSHEQNSYAWEHQVPLATWLEMKQGTF